MRIQKKEAGDAERVSFLANARKCPINLTNVHYNYIKTSYQYKNYIKYTNKACYFPEIGVYYG